MSWALNFFLTDQPWEKIIIRKSTWKYFWYLPTIVKDWIGYNKPVILFLTRTLAHDELDFYCESTLLLPFTKSDFGSWCQDLKYNTSSLFIIRISPSFKFQQILYYKYTWPMLGLYTQLSICSSTMPPA